MAPVFSDTRLARLIFDPWYNFRLRILGSEPSDCYLPHIYKIKKDLKFSNHKKLKRSKERFTKKK